MDFLANTKNIDIIKCVFIFSVLLLLPNLLHGQKLNFITDFGNENNPENFKFASIQDIAVNGNKIFVLDNVLHEIHFLEFSNSELIRVGDLPIRRGRGPGEVSDPTSLTVSDNYIIVGDARNQKIVIFNHAGDVINEFVI